MRRKCIYDSQIFEWNCLILPTHISIRQWPPTMQKNLHDITNCTTAVANIIVVFTDSYIHVHACIECKLKKKKKKKQLIHWENTDDKNLAMPSKTANNFFFRSLRWAQIMTVFALVWICTVNFNNLIFDLSRRCFVVFVYKLHYKSHRILF